jgi:hypothetical protein
MVMYAGIQWITAAGNSSKIENAKSTMNGAFIGLVLALSSYVILNTINPELVTLRVPFVDQVKPEFGGGFCTTINGIDYQVLADNDGKKCGEVFQFTDANDSKKNKICMSASCPTPQSCIECERKDFPFDSCEGTGLECGFYDSRVIVEGRVVDAGTHPVKWVKFFRKNIKAGDSDTAFVWKEVDKIDDESKFVTGGTFTFDTLKPVPLNGFNFHVSFDDGSIPGDRECGWIDPSGQEDFYVFDLEYGVGQAAQKSFNFDFSEIYTTCTS